MRIDRSLVIRATAETVWPLLENSAQVRLWLPELVSDVPLEPGPPRVGSISRMRIREGSRTVEYECEITALAPRSHLGLELRGGSLGTAPMRLDYRLQPNDKGVALRYTSVWSPRELSLKLFSPLLGILARRNAGRALARLRQLAELS